MKLKNLLIANPENHYKPWIVTKTAMACFVLSIWVLRMFLPGYIAIGAPGLDAVDLMSRINIERTNRQLPALAINNMLTTASTIKSQDMIDREYFAHVDPDGNYAWPLIEAQGYKPYKSLGENLAVDFTSAASVVNAWMNSPGHRANILSEKYEDQGMAAIYGDFENHDTYLITNLFGTLMKSPIPVPPQEPTPTPTPVPNPQPSQATPTTQSPTPIPTPAPSAVVSQATAPEQTPEQTQESFPVTEQSEETYHEPDPVLKASDKQDLRSLKIVIGIFAGLYTIFLAIDSFIIHRARIRRENIPSSPHALLMLMIALVNFFTIWI